MWGRNCWIFEPRAGNLLPPNRLYLPRPVLHGHDISDHHRADSQRQISQAVNVLHLQPDILQHALWARTTKLTSTPSPPRTLVLWDLEPVNFNQGVGAPELWGS